MAAIKDIILTEKSVRLAQAGQFTFCVEPHASIEKIAKEIETLYGVHVTAVRTANLPAKVRGRGKYLGKRSAFKKAMVSLKKGEKIQAFVIETEEKKEKEAPKQKSVEAKKAEVGKGREVKEKQFLRKAI